MAEDAAQYFDAANPAFEGDFRSNGQIFWYASEFVYRLGYKDYSPTMPPINKAMSVCLGLASVATADHFREEARFIAGKNQKDFKLSRFACCLVAMNADVKKEPVAKAQAYFAAFAASVHEYIRTADDIDRVPLRKEISQWEKTLSGTAHMSGVENYAYFANAGYMGLYNMPINRVREIKGTPAGETPLNYMGAEELGANIFRITQTNAKIKKEALKGQGELEDAARQVGGAVRRAIAETGGTMPEDLPPEVHIGKIKSELKKTSREFTKEDKKLIEGKPSE